MKKSWKNFSVLFVIVALALGIGVNAQAAGKVRVALGDVASVENLCFLVALDRAKDRGVSYELTAFAKEELAIQAIINGQMDIGVGTPYSVIQKTKVPIRNFYQIQKLIFFAVVSKEYKTWKDLDGQPFTFHARGTGTEAIGNIIAKREGINFGQRSYVPGSENRIIAMTKGQIKASIIDLANKNKLMSMASDRFHILPGVTDPVTDEALFADINWLKKNKETVAILTEELLKTWREMVTDPTIMDKERKKRNLLSDLPKELLAEVDTFYKDAKEGDLHDPDGGLTAPKVDFEFYVNAGQMTGPAESLKVEDFWYLEPLQTAIAKLGKY